MGAPDFDPDDVASLGERLLAYLSASVTPATYLQAPSRLTGGRDTYIYALQLAGDLPPEWTAPLILRVYPRPEQTAKAEREASVQRFAASAGYPAPRPLLVVTEGSPLGLPFMLMPRLPGVVAMDRVKNPLAIPGLLRRLADAQAQLHAVPVTGCPLPSEPPLADRLLAEIESDAARLSVDAGEMTVWLRDHRRLVADETPRLTHNDFHPLNVLLDGDRLYVLDWSDAALGDRHCDVARTLALFWLAPPLARSAVERTLLTLLRGYLVRNYRKAYERNLPLDERRLRYWQALHAARAFVTVKALKTGKGVELGAREGAADEVPDAMLPALEAYFRERVAGL